MLADGVFVYLFRLGSLGVVSYPLLPIIFSVCFFLAFCAWAAPGSGVTDIGATESAAAAFSSSGLFSPTAYFWSVCSVTRQRCASDHIAFRVFLAYQLVACCVSSSLPRLSVPQESYVRSWAIAVGINNVSQWAGLFKTTAQTILLATILDQIGFIRAEPWLETWVDFISVQATLFSGRPTTLGERMRRHSARHVLRSHALGCIARGRPRQRLFAVILPAEMHDLS